MYTHPSSFHVVGLVRQNGSSDIKLSDESADLSCFFINFLFSLLVFFFVFFSLDPVKATEKEKLQYNKTGKYHMEQHNKFAVRANIIQASVISF